MTDVRLLESEHLSDTTRRAIRRLLDAAYGGDFSDDDWQHALGGWHAIVSSRDELLAHAAVVERRIEIGPRAFRAGYVEAVAVAPAHQRTGLGTAAMATVTEHVRSRFELGALSTGEWHFYERLGWERWRGPSYVRGGGHSVVRTEDEDAAIMVLRCSATQHIDPQTSITCEERSGDSW